MNASLRKVQIFMQDISMMNRNTLRKGCVKKRGVTILVEVTSLRPRGRENDKEQHGVWKAEGDGGVGD